MRFLNTTMYVGIPLLKMRIVLRELSSLNRYNREDMKSVQVYRYS